MANLPWNLSYFSIFMCLLLILSKLYFSPMKFKTISSPVNNSKKLHTNNWKW